MIKYKEFIQGDNIVLRALVAIFKKVPKRKTSSASVMSSIRA